MLQTLKFNLANAPIRYETLKGRQYVVAPMAMMTVGVHNGSGGPLLYEETDLQQSVPAWNMKPIVVYHPEINGQGVSACDPDILEKQQVGHVMNTAWNGKLRAEAWIDVEQANAIDDRVMAALETNSMMEVSTGLFTTNVEESGEWNGEPYTHIARNHQPDHLALLPDQIGACSIADGAGLLQMNEAAKAAGATDVDRLFARQLDTLRRMVGNALSHSNIHSALRTALKERFPLGKDQYLWIADVYDDFVVYEIEGDGKVTLYRLDYTMEGATIALSDADPVEVVRVTEYRTPTGDFVGNEARTTNKEPVMDKKQIVDGLIANADSPWTEEDRDTLMGMDEAVLAKVDNKGTMKKVGDEEDEDAVQNAAAKGAEGVAAPAAPKQPTTAQEYIDAAPPGVREMLQNGLRTHEAQKAGLIEQIIANKGNPFTKEFLATKGIEELQGMVALAGNSEPKAQEPVPMFAGQATPAHAPTANAEGEGADAEPLAIPTMNFGTAEKAEAATA